jgi:nitrate reductase NapE component
MWLSAYLCGCMATAIIALNFANESREIRAARPLTRAVLALLAGALWPVLVVGLLELAFIVWLAQQLRITDSDDSVGTNRLEKTVPFTPSGCS